MFHSTQSNSVFDHLLASIQKAADYNHDDTVAPAAVLWADEKREWERLVPRLRATLPNFFVFGSYDKANRTGPAIWLRCVLAGTVAGVLDDASQAGSLRHVPIIYLPGVSRATLRATEECPPELKPLAEVTQSPLTGATTADMVRVYTEGGWRADAAVLDSLAAVSLPPDRDAVCAAIAHVYTPWLRDAAELFQERVNHNPLPGREVPRLGEVSAGVCVLFADGLRFDVGQKLKAALANRVGQITEQHHFAALPSVTPTAKPAVSPVAGKITGTTAGEEFRPSVALDSKELTIDRFRSLLDDDGIQVLGANDVGHPAGRAWVEFGNVDSTANKGAAAFVGGLVFGADLGLR